MKLTAYFTILLAAVVLVSCQKKITNDAITNNNSGGNTGTTSGSDYQPVTANSEWSYKNTTLGNYTIRALGSDTTIGGIKYYKFQHSLGGTQFMNKNNGVYSSVGMISPQQYAIMVYLKDAPVGTKWTNTVNNQGTVSVFNHTIEARDLQRTVNGKNFSNVIKVVYEQLIQTPAGTVPFGTSEQYYAKGVGAIEGVTVFGMMGITTTDSTSILSYNIK